jgi:zinc transport system substrate-binding protein
MKTASMKMQRVGMTVILCISMVIMVLLTAACSKQTPPPKNGTVVIVTTIFPIYDMTKQVGKDKVQVIMLLPPGSEAHTFELRPSDIVQIEKADIFIYNGAGLEPWADKLLNGISNKKLVIVDASKRTHLIPVTDSLGASDGSAPNPHLWLDISNDKLLVDSIAQAIMQKDSFNAQEYLQNAQDYKQELDILDKEYTSALKNCSSRIIITGGHNAFGYLGVRYDLKTIAAFGIAPDSDPTPQRVKQIIDLAEKNNVSTIFFEELVNPAFAESIAKEANIKTLVLNPGDGITKTEFENNVTFVNLMQSNLNNLKSGLGCS